jgi:hypothetical protein
MVGYPPPKDFGNMVCSNMIHNFPITPLFDIAASYKIFGPDMSTLTGTMMRNTPEPVLTDNVKIPKEIMDLNRDVNLAADIIFVSGLGFLVSASRELKFTTIL